MKTYKSFVFALLLAALSLGLSFSVFAQKTALPSGLTENSSLEEILGWIDRTSLPEARIGLEANVQEPQPDEILTAHTRYYEWAFFSKGFRLDKIDGCKVKLKNDRVELLYFISGYPDPSRGSLDEFRKTQNSQFTGELSIPLKELKANKSPYRHTKKAAKAALLGTWRVEFKLKTNFNIFSIFPAIWSKEKAKEKIEEIRENAMKIEIINAGPNGRNDLMDGDELTFTFDDKQMSENFYAAFSRAIILCKDK